MKLKKMWAVLLAAAMLATPLCGCSSSNNGASSGTETSQEEEPVQLKFYINSQRSNDEDRVMEKANKIIEEKINANLEIIKVADYAEKMNMMINSNEKFDLCFTANWGGINYFENASKGAYYDLTDMIDKYAPESYSRIPESLWDGIKVDGRIYAIINYQMHGAASCNGIGFRKDLVEEFNFDYASLKDKNGVEAFRAIEPFLQQVVEKHPEMVPFEYENKADLFAASPLYFGMESVGDLTSPGWVGIHDGDSPKVFNQYASEEYKDYVYMMRDWFEKGYVKKDAATMKEVTPDREAGLVASCRQTGWPDTVDLPRDLYMPNTDTGVSKKPMVTVSFTETMIPASKASDAAVAIGANSDNPEKALQLIELLNTDDELYRLITLGEEGIDWKYAEADDPENNIKKGDYVLDTNKYTFNWCEWMIGQSYSPDFSRSLYNNNESGELTKKAQQMVYDADKTALASPVAGFTFNTEPVKTEYAQCSAIISEMVPALGSGSVDPDQALPEFLNRLEKAGVNKIIEEKQKQIDEWKAASK